MGQSGKFSKRNDRDAKRAAKKVKGELNQREVWSRPPEADWDPPGEFSVALTATSRLFVRANYYQGKCIDFAICHQVGGPLHWKDLFRIDSSHDTVHRHDFTGRREVKETIEVISDPLTVDRQYAEQYDFMLATWERREEEWKK